MPDRGRTSSPASPPRSCSARCARASARGSIAGSFAIAITTSTRCAAPARASRGCASRPSSRARPSQQVVDAVRAERGALYMRDGDRQLATRVRVGDVAEPSTPLDGLDRAGRRTAPTSRSSCSVRGASGDLYSSQDRDLLAALASQLAVAFANARAFGTIAELSRTLETQNVEIRELRDRLEDENRLLRAARRGRDRRRDAGRRLARDPRARRGPSSSSRAARRACCCSARAAPARACSSRLVHAASPRADGPFLRVDCGAIAAAVFESELFGHERGAFTGATRLRRGPIELADGGTLFLDEIGELPLELQPKLLRVLEERAVLRVGATHAGRRSTCASSPRRIAISRRWSQRGEFREDLYFRLRVVEIVVPPLRERLVDLPALCESLLPRAARRCGRAVKPLAARARSNGWPRTRGPATCASSRTCSSARSSSATAPTITAAELELAGSPAAARAARAARCRARRTTR